MIRQSLRALVALFGAAALGQVALAQGVVINEFQYDDSGTDDREFVELYNAGAAPVDISGWVLEARDASGANPSYTVPASTILAPGAFYVFGPSANVANVNQVVGTTNLWENDNESLTLRDASSQIVDTLVYEANKGLGVLAAFVEGEGIWGNFTSIDANPTSWSRVRDGYDTNDNRDFVLRPITPGASNNVPQIEKYYESYDALTPGNALADMVGSFVTPRVIDPTVAGGFNTGAIVPSPQGGNAAVCWDTSGGGNAATVLIDGENRNLCVEGYFYFDATPEVLGEHESWSIGFQWTTDSFFNTPDPGENLGAGFTANGNTGISWTYQTTNVGGTLYLIDHGNGGWGALAQNEPRVHAMIPVRAGFNDGWRRLRLQISGDFVEAFFDGEAGCREFSWNFQLRTPNPAWGAVYLGYREFVTNNATLRPLTFDALDIRTGAASGMHLFGQSSPNSTGFAPVIELNKFGLFGDSNVALRFRNLKPGAPAQLFLGYFALPFPIPLAGLGAQPTTELLILPDQNFTIGGDINGRDAVMGFTICTPTPGGVEFFAQIFELDLDLLPSFALPLASSQAMRIVIG